MPGIELLIAGICHDYMYAACEQFVALAALYHANEVLLAPNVIARCAVEHVARIAWILGAPSESVDERFARALIEEVAGAEQPKTTAGHLIGKTNQEYRARRQQWNLVKTEAKRVYPDFARHPVSGRPTIRDMTLPRPEEVVTAVFGRLAPPLPEKQREGIYDFLSNHVHPTPYTTRELFRSGPNASGERVPELAVDPEYHGKLARLTVTPFHLTLAVILSYNGWPDTALKQLESAIDDALPGTLVDTLTI